MSSGAERVLRRYGQDFTAWHACGHGETVNLGPVAPEAIAAYQQRAAETPCGRCRIGAAEQERREQMTEQERRRERASLWPDD